MRSPFQLEIPKRSSQCCKQGEKLTPGMEYYSMLLEDEVGKIKRQDYCTNCWTGIIGSQELANSRGYWKSKIDVKEKAPPTSRGERALLLLKTLLENPVGHEADIFVLALLLAHMRRVVLRKEIEQDGVKYGLYEILHKEEFVTIKTISLSNLETARIQESLASQLNPT